MSKYGAGELLNGFIEFFLSSNKKSINMGLIISPKKTILVSYKKNNEFLLEENNNDNKLLVTNIEDKYLKM